MVTTMNKSEFKPSVYQAGVFEWIKSGSGHAVIKAVPGSGKSTTLIQASLLLPANARAVFLAFNRSIKEELNIKLPALGSSMQAQTINSFGLSALNNTGKKYKTVGNKYNDICKEYLLSRNAYKYEVLTKIKKLVSLVRMTLCKLDEDSVLTLCAHYDIDVDPHYEKQEWTLIYNSLKPILAKGEEIAKRECIIDFDDQVYLPIIWDLTPEKQDWIFIDESQDLNAARLELILKACSAKGRMLFVGDECQSIYGFSGADTNSMNNIVKRTNAMVLPLSICYRCPSLHIDLCASVFPGLEARPNAPQGKIERINPEQLEGIVREGDLILCRLTAPLVSTCLQLIRAGVRAKVRGSDIGANFVSTIQKLNKQYAGRLTIANFRDYLLQYRTEQALLIGIGEDSEMKIAALDDRVDTMYALHEAYRSQNEKETWSLDAFYVYIVNFFSDKRGPLVVLSTVHKAKGLEEKRVFILRPEMMPFPKAKLAWQKEQEENIRYVAYSRSMDELYFVAPSLDLCPFFVEQLLEEKEEAVAIAESILAPVVETPAIIEVVPEPATIKTSRVCLKCGAKLSQYNTEKYCWPCQESNQQIEAMSEPAQESVKTNTTSLPKQSDVKRGRGNASDWVKVAYKFSPEVVAKLNKLAEANPDLNKSAFIDGLLAQWFEEHGL